MICRSRNGRWLGLVVALAFGGCAEGNRTGSGAGGDTDTGGHADDLESRDSADDTTDGAEVDAPTDGDAASRPEVDATQDDDVTSGDDSGDVGDRPETGGDDTLDGALDAVDASDIGDSTDGGDIDAPPIGPPPLFDLEAIRDVATAECTFSNERSAFRNGKSLRVWDVSLVSWEADDGRLVPIRLRGFAARPVSSTGPGSLPGVVQVHGLGGHALPTSATGPAALLDAFTIAITGPGGGDPAEPASISEGRGPAADDGYRLFDVVPDPRGTWLWSHAVGAMRATTCLTARPEVDTTKLGMTGYSGGGIATLISASVDDRLAAAVPVSGTGGWRSGAASANSWFHALLTQAGLDTSSDEWLALTATIDPVSLLGSARVPVLLVNGSTDEFFPLVSHTETLGAMPGTTPQRTSIAANMDHGCYALTGIEAASRIEERALLRVEGAQRLWFHHHFGTDGRYERLPAQPVATVTPAGLATHVFVSAESAGYTIERIDLWWSTDDGLFFLSEEIDGSGGTREKLLLVPYPENAIWFVDVQYRVGSIIDPFPQRFSLSTIPHIPAGHVPQIRGITTCQP